MRRALILASAALHRALRSTNGGLPASAFQYRLLQVALYGNSTAAGDSSSSARQRWFSSAALGGSAEVASLGAAGAVVTLAVAAASFQEASAKERPPQELIPKEVVLYQYEACPFCNKVKAKRENQIESMGGGSMDIELKGDGLCFQWRI
ncbi:glutathione S-transferase family protein [Actinidia rufa]|uniref:Glutathione S-transferase family protein n=1 Tax=Actinidia rufa TaxID=165716 RepID=A0A7J0FB45_9ERIC|nr:glutathione S-transferase family protein [Actinidia rufa]